MVDITEFSEMYGKRVVGECVDGVSVCGVFDMYLSEFGNDLNVPPILICTPNTGQEVLGVIA